MRQSKLEGEKETAAATRKVGEEVGRLEQGTRRVRDRA